MLAKFVLAASALVSLAAADVIPTGPTPGDKFNEGANCLIQYTPDTTGKWENTTIQLMSGGNLDMVVVADVVTGLDGSTGGVINWDCPAVTPNSQIYFYQYSAPGQATSWTGRFTIASATGASTEPTNTTTSGGQTIKYGYGALTDPSETIAEPSISGGVIATGSASATGGSSASNSTSSAMVTSASSSSFTSRSSSSAAAQSSSASDASTETDSVVTVMETDSSAAAATSAPASAASKAATTSASTPASGAASLQIGGALSALVGLVGFIALA